MPDPRPLVPMLAVLTAVIAPVEAQPAAPPSFADKVSEFVTTTMELHEVPGLALAVTRDGTVVYLEAFGVRNVDTGEPVKTDSLFHMASVSKPFVATAVVQLAERGRIDLDAPVASYLPYFELDDPRSSQITVRQMLNHTSGMPDVEDYQWDNPQYDEGAAERYVRSLADMPLRSEPGERYDYSNMAFDTLGDVIAKVSGEPFEVYVKKNILDPIGMTESTFLYPQTPQSLRTSGHVWDLQTRVAGVYPYNRAHAPSSTLNASVLEMTNWLFVNLNRGEWRGRRILDEKSYELLWTPSVEVGGNTNVGLSWFLGDYHGRLIIAHGGSDVGFTSYVAMVPGDRLGLVIASNFAETPVGGLRNGILAILYGDEPELPKRSIAWEFARALDGEGLDAARTQYFRLKTEAPDRYDFHDRELNALGYALMQRGKTDDALAVFRFNVEQHRDVANCWDSLGEASLKLGNRDEAIRCYKKALEVDPEFENARHMLETIEAGT